MGKIIKFLHGLLLKFVRGFLLNRFTIIATWLIAAFVWIPISRQLGVDLLDPDQPLIGNLLNPWFDIGLLFIALPAYHFVNKFNGDVGGKIESLRGAAFELVRLMETTLDGNDGKADKLHKIVQQFAVDGPAQIAGSFYGPATVRAPASPPDPTLTSTAHPILLPDKMSEMAMKLMERRLGDMASFGASRGNVCAALGIFIQLMTYNNMQCAYFLMTEYLRKQRTTGGMPNLPELKDFFWISRDPPKEDTPLPGGMSWWQDQVTSAALKRGKAQILAEMAYNPKTPEGKLAIVIRGADVLTAMRTFLRTPDTYDPALASPFPA